ncbi:hypothetical protein APHAL10511_005457 [Amanita phalloides]|nr:hypothetical protein APHAL10511_005457 [Amanita phalloides]
MGVTGLWEVLRPAAETRSMTDLAITEGFIANPQGLRGFRVGIDASIWFFHAEYGKEGENPVLRTLFFRCATLMRTTFLPLFVFDGPKRPDFKRGKRINKTSHKLIPGMKAIIEAFGFEWRMAPAEAEAELAYLNRAGIIDAVLSDDVDNFLFGATAVIRNISNNLSGNRANPILNSQGRDDKNHTRLYRASNIRSHSSISLTRGGLILIGLLSGGDYAQAGLPGCGITIAHALARCGFGDSLYEAATTLPRETLSHFLSSWRQQLREELRTNSRGIIGRKLAKLAKDVPESFPNIDILLSYTSPITSESLGRAVEKNMKLTWGKEPDVGKLAALCEFYFEWGYKEAIIKRFRTVLWHSIVLRILRRAIINAEAAELGLSRHTVPSTPRKSGRSAQPRILNTPSKMIAKHFASLGIESPPQSSKKQDLDSEDDEPLIVKICSSRNHASTDGLLEYRLEVAPAQLVRLTESGIKGMRDPPEADEWASEEDAAQDDDDSDAGKKTKGPKPPPDPASHLRLWMPACMVEIAEPEIVAEYREREGKKAAKKNGKTRTESGAVKKTKTKPSTSSKQSKTLTKPLYESDVDQRQTIEDMLARRGVDMPSTPSRALNRAKREAQLMREESEGSESETLPAIPTFIHKANSKLPQMRSESSKTALERQKCGKAVPNYVSLSEDEVPSQLSTSKRAMAPFPISLVKEDAVFSTSSSETRLTSSRPSKTNSQTSDSEIRKSPRKSANSHRRAVSPSPPRPSKGVKKTVNMSIIEISSEDSDDSDIGPSAVLRSTFQPLMLAKARSLKNQNSETAVALKMAKSKQTSTRDREMTVIDLT